MFLASPTTEEVHVQKTKTNFRGGIKKKKEPTLLPSTMPPKTKMAENEFYDVRTKSRIKFKKSDISKKIIPAEKYRDNKPRYMLVAEYENKDGEIKKVQKFCTAAIASKFPLYD